MSTCDMNDYYLRGKRWCLDFDANAQKPIPFDWTSFLAKEGMELDSVEFILDPLLTSVDEGHDATHATVWVTPGEGAKGLLPITCRISTDSSPPLIEDQTIYLNIINK